MKKKIEIKLPANLRFSALLRFVSQDIFAFAGFSKEWCGRLKLVVDELFMNAVCYGSTENNSIVSMSFSYDDQSLEFTIADDGSGPNKITADELRKLVDKNIKNNNVTQISGRGLAMITNLWTDELNITESPEGGILVSFVKKIESSAPPVPSFIEAKLPGSVKGDNIAGKVVTAKKAPDDKSAVVVNLRGDIDPFNIERTVIPIDEEVKNLPKNTSLILDFKNVDYVNSIFIGHLAAWYKDVNKKNGMIILRNTDPQIKDVLDLVGLGKVITIES